MARKETRPFTSAAAGPSGPPPALRDPFRALVASLRADGLDREAAALEDVLDTAFSSSSELLGEVGAVLTRIRQEPGRRWSAASTRWFHASMDAVHQAWPRM